MARRSASRILAPWSGTLSLARVLLLQVALASLAAGFDEAFDGAGEFEELGGGHAVHEAGVVIAQLFSEGLDDGLATRLEPDADASPVVRGDFATDETAAFEAFEECGDGRAGDIEALGELGVAEAFLFGEVPEEAELGDGEVFPIPNGEPNRVEQGACAEECGDGAFLFWSALRTPHETPPTVRIPPVSRRRILVGGSARCKLGSEVAEREEVRTGLTVLLDCAG